MVSEQENDCFEVRGCCHSFRYRSKMMSGNQAVAELSIINATIVYPGN